MNISAIFSIPLNPFNTFELAPGFWKTLPGSAFHSMIAFYPKETNVKSWQSLWMFDSKGNVILETIHIKKLRNQLELIINKSNFNGKYIFLFLFHLVLNRNRFGLNMKFYLNLQIPSALSGTWFWKKEVGILAKKAKKTDKVGC